MRVLRYAFDEACLSLWRGRRSGLLSTATIAVALFVLGAFLLVTSNLQRLGEEWSRSAEVSVYLRDDVSGAARAALERTLAPGEVVASYEFVSKADALQRFKQTFADLASTIDTLETNPLPASYEVRLRPAHQASDEVETLTSALRAAEGVSDVRYDTEWLTRLLSVVATVRAAGLALGGILVFAAALTVANVVRLALYARRDELDIMELVGAPSSYVRGPFILEGLLQGGLGAAVALGGLALAFAGARGRYIAPLAAALNVSSFEFLSPGLIVLLLGGGMLVGCLGGAVACRKAGGT